MTVTAGRPGHRRNPEGEALGGERRAEPSSLDL